ncbi:MAG: penicillin acylase family protein [Gemmatimonadota bacterium]
MPSTHIRLRSFIDRIRKPTARSGPAAPLPRMAGFTAAGLLLVAGCSTAPAPAGPEPIELPPLATQVEIRRTTYGVPQIHAENLRAAAFALAYVQLEDHGPRIIEGIHSARGRMALVEGRQRIDADARNRQRRARAAETFPLLLEDTRHVYEGFAEGMNHFIRARRDELPPWMEPDFTAEDVLARDISWPSDGEMEDFRELLLENPGDPALLVATETGGWRRAAMRLDAQPLSIARRLPDEEDQNVGSNAWALAPERTTSGAAILLRNPHLSWTAGYYEAHVRVPGKLDFYGDFRIGGPFTVIGGFNPYLGFATTNNSTRSHEFYAFRADPSRPDHIVLDGESLPLEREVVTVEYRDASGSGSETREFWTSEFGPVVHRADSLVYVFRPAANGEYRAGEQWLEMMQASTLEEWQNAMRIGARTTSHFTYADRDGNIHYVSMSGAPLLPHPSGGDTLAIYATREDQVWSEVTPFESLPQLLNPPGGYLHNENDSPHYANLNQVLDHSFEFWVEPPRLRLRSQHSLELLHNERTFSLEDVVAAKHSMRMLLADRVKEDLLAAVREAEPDAETSRAAALLAAWNNTVAADSRGGLLFETWWNRYRSLLDGEEPHAVPWSANEPSATPSGLADPRLAAEAFEWAVPEAGRRFGSWDAPWGEVHRVRRGNVDAPVGGCGGALGCFRVLNFTNAEDGKRVVNGGDGWVLAVEFGERPRAYTVLAYGQSPDSGSPYHANQAALFASNGMKPVHWTEEEIQAAVVESYRPGEAREGAP